MNFNLIKMRRGGLQSNSSISHSRILLSKISVNDNLESQKIIQKIVEFVRYDIYMLLTQMKNAFNAILATESRAHFIRIDLEVLYLCSLAVDESSMFYTSCETFDNSIYIVSLQHELQTLTENEVDDTVLYFDATCKYTLVACMSEYLSKYVNDVRVHHVLDC